MSYTEQDKARIRAMADEIQEEKTRKNGVWLVSFAENGWVDWKCSNCGWTWNDDIHVHLDYKYCPCCGTYMERSVFDAENSVRCDE